MYIQYFVNKYSVYFIILSIGISNQIFIGLFFIYVFDEFKFCYQIVDVYILFIDVYIKFLCY